MSPAERLFTDVIRDKLLGRRWSNTLWLSKGTTKKRNTPRSTFGCCRASLLSVTHKAGPRVARSKEARHWNIVWKDTLCWAEESDACMRVRGSDQSWIYGFLENACQENMTRLDLTFCVKDIDKMLIIMVQVPNSNVKFILKLSCIFILLLKDTASL